MEIRYIKLVDDITFTDPTTGKVIKEQVLKDPDIDIEPGEPGESPELVTKPIVRSFEFFVRRFILTHSCFTMKVGGFAAVESGLKILAAIKNAVDAGDRYIALDADHARIMKRVLSAPPKAKDDKTAISAAGMPEMNFYESTQFFPFMESVMNQMTKIPDELEPDTAESAPELPVAASTEESAAAGAVN